MRPIKTNVEAKCYLCGVKAQLHYVNFSEFVCEKDKQKFDKFLSRLKHRRTRTTAAALIKRYSNGGGDEPGPGSQAV